MDEPGYKFLMMDACHNFIELQIVVPPQRFRIIGNAIQRRCPESVNFLKLKCFLGFSSPWAGQLKEWCSSTIRQFHTRRIRASGSR
jgi:hypothetical protein